MLTNTKDNVSIEHVGLAVEYTTLTTNPKIPQPRQSTIQVKWNPLDEGM